MPAPPISNLGSKPGAIVSASLVHVSAFYSIVSALSLPKLFTFHTGGCRVHASTPHFEFRVQTNLYRLCFVSARYYL
ncbi:Uncharacterized protein FWK35_00013585 [Aphis craccivora]|uniref:Uncharacterized protein n=1 Tax=Aphis craccivora TaxID=307492 RepID=A0A6G0Y6J7_APHCR|nr:Uncharacterized protein FWK35_00013585 [Aphis craccivora]